MAVIIPLTVHRKEIKKIYYANGNLRLFLGPKTILPFGIFLGALVCIILIEFFIPVNHWRLFLSIFLLFASLLKYLIAASTIWQARKSITTFLDEIDRIKQHTIVYDDATFQLIQDEIIHAVEWSNFTGVQFGEDFFHLAGETDFLIPRSAMTDMQFEDLAAFVKRKLDTEKDTTLNNT